MSDIKAIETYYKGYRFRSRLEARWAVFFDALGVAYEYEPEGFQLSNGECYLPDFYLPIMQIYVEVKSANVRFIEHKDNYVSFSKDTWKYGLFAHDISEAGYGAWFVFGDPVDALLDEKHGAKGMNELFCNCGCGIKAFEKDHNQTCICHDSSEKRMSECTFKTMASSRVIMLAHEFAITSLDKYLIPDNAHAFPIEMLKDVGGHMKNILKEAATNTLQSALKARQARFEHGEMPIF